MTDERTGRTALVTGASAGLGETIALACAKEGWRLALGARRVERVEDVARRARARSNARYIGITGSSGKSTTTALLAHMISGQAPAVSQLFRNTMDMLTRFLGSDLGDAEYVVIELGAKTQKT